MLNEIYKAEEVLVSEINDNKITEMSIPYYQRPYSWTIAQAKQLIDDISIEKKEYLIGNITCKVKNDSSSEVAIIDGQQRLTTIVLISLSLLLFYWCITGKKEKNIYNFIYKGSSKRKNGSLWLISNGLDKKPLENLGKKIFDIVEGKKGKKEKKIKFKDVYNKIVEEINENEEGNITKIFVKICQYFNEVIFTKKNTNDISKFFNKFGGKKNSIIKFVLIRAKVDDSESIKIFNNINAKGKPLEQIDLLKNYVFSKITSQKEINQYFDYWGEINKYIYNLSDYVLTFLRANGEMWKGAFKEKNFEELYHSPNKVMKFVRDLNAKKTQYLYFLNKTERDKKNTNIDNASVNKAKFAMDMYRAGNYKFVRPVIYKIFTENNRYSSIFDVVNFSFMAKTLELLSLKDIEETMKNISISGLNSIDKFLSKIVKEKSITKEKIISKLMEYTSDAYGKKNMTKYLLAFYQAQGDASYIDLLLNEYEEKNLQIDHHISKKAKKGDYACYYNSKTDTFDFDKDNDFEYDGSIDANEFIKTRLNNIGNLSYMSRIQNNKKKNKIDGNVMKLLSENKKYGTEKIKDWKSIRKRQEEICNYLCDNMFKFVN